MFNYQNVLGIMSTHEKKKKKRLEAQIKPVAILILEGE